MNFYYKENQILKSQLEDTKITLSINKDLLFKYISQSKGNDTSYIYNELQEENSRLNEKMNSVYEEKNKLEKKVRV